MKSSSIHISFDLGDAEPLWAATRDAFQKLLEQDPAAGPVAAMALSHMAMEAARQMEFSAGVDRRVAARHGMPLNVGALQDENAAKLMRINFVCVGPDDKLCAAKVHGYKVFCDQCERTWDISHLDEVTPS